jgi:uncharacterized membrane protein
MTRLRLTWGRLRSSYWLVPAVMAVLSVAAAVVSVALDNWYPVDSDSVFGRLVGGPEGARAVLTTIAGSMITVAGLVFSITMVALSQASSQFGPRLLVNYLRDPGNQVVLGTFIAAFLFSLVVLRSVRGEPGPPFVPHLAVTAALLLAVASLGVLIYFIHHAATSLRVEFVIAGVVRDLDAAIDRHCPAREAGAAAARGGEASGIDTVPPAEHAAAVSAPTSGYVQAVDTATVVEAARTRDAQVWLRCRPGHFLVEGTGLAWITPLEAGDRELADTVRRSLVIAGERSADQDLEFAINQLVEIALRALSPGINDPFTAIACIDHLSAALARIATRPPPASAYFDEDGVMRVRLDGTDFEGLLGTAFDQLRQISRGNAAVSIRLLEALARIAEVAAPEVVRAVRAQADMIHRAGLAALPEARDRDALTARFEGIGLIR